MPTVHLPAALAGYAAGQRRLELPLAPAGPGPGPVTTTVRELLATIGHHHPGVRQRVLDDRGELRRHVNVYVGGEDVRQLDGLATPVGEDDEVWVIPSVSGG